MKETTEIPDETTELTTRFLLSVCQFNNASPWSRTEYCSNDSFEISLLLSRILQLAYGIVEQD